MKIGVVIIILAASTSPRSSTARTSEPSLSGVALELEKSVDSNCNKKNLLKIAGIKKEILENATSKIYDWFVMF